jgi:Adenylosuccinate synthetase
MTHPRIQCYCADLERTGLVNPRAINLIGSGCVVHLPSFFQEVEELQNKGLNTDDRIYMSDRCHLIFDVHQICDGLNEAELGSKSIGTTKKGIGPSYTSKSARDGIRVHHLFHWEEFEPRFRKLVATRRKRYGDFDYDVEAELERYKVYPSATKLMKGICGEVARVCRRCCILHARCLRRPKTHSLRRRQRNHARSRFRHLSIRDVLFNHHRRRMYWPGNPPATTLQNHRSSKSIHHTRRRWSFSHRATQRTDPHFLTYRRILARVCRR